MKTFRTVLRNAVIVGGFLSVFMSMYYETHGDFPKATYQMVLAVFMFLPIV